MQLMPTSNSRAIGLSSQSSIDLLELFWRRRTYVMACTLIGIVLGVLYCGLATPMYESTADVLVVQKRPQAVTGDHQYESGFEDYLAEMKTLTDEQFADEAFMQALNEKYDIWNA